MRPVSTLYRISQPFGSMRTAGVVASSNPASGVGYYVYLYGNYQPYGHAGCDIACPVGTPIYAPADGTVLYSGWTEDLPGTGDVRKWLFYYNFGGILTVIQHNGWISAIAHQSNNDAVRPGMWVKEGQLIGKSGNTKTRTTKVAPHVHVEALVDLTYRTGGGLIYGRTNPEQYFGSAAIAPQGSTATTTAPAIAKEWSDMATKQEVTEAVMDALSWAVDDGEGGKLSVYGLLGIIKPMVHAVPDELLDTEIPRGGGEFPGNTSPRAVFAYQDQKHIEAIRATVTAAHGDGASADQIIEAVLSALKSGVKVEASVTVGQ